jgi:site-specific DNA-cytosine methylase
MNRSSRILIACEESGVVTDAFMDIGFTNVWSCDLLPCSGKNLNHHLQQDVTELLKQEWDMIIAFPPCTHLAVSGAAWFKQKIADGRQQQGIDFFLKFTNLKCPKVAIENPIGIMSRLYKKPSQIIHPWQFGHMEQKSTCLWLKGLPLLVETNNVYEEMMKLPKNERERLHYLPPSQNRAMIRSKTYFGIAAAFAEQWSDETNIEKQISLF